MLQPDPDQDAAYERAVLKARQDPRLAAAVRSAFLDEDPGQALERFTGSEHWARMRRLMDAEGVGPGAKVLDFGGGRGLVTASLAIAGFESVLCEPNPSPVCGTGAAEELRAVAGVSFEIVNDGVQALAEESFDAVVCRAVVHHLEPRVPILRTVAAVLKPGGPLICSDEPMVRGERDLAALQDENVFVQFGVEETALTKGQYIEALEQAGFERVRVVFPVEWRDYRRHIRPSTPALLAAPLYLRYRIRSTVFPKPGEVRSVLARKPK